MDYVRKFIDLFFPDLKLYQQVMLENILTNGIRINRRDILYAYRFSRNSGHIATNYYFDEMFRKVEIFKKFKTLDEKESTFTPALAVKINDTVNYFNRTKYSIAFFNPKNIEDIKIKFKK